MTANQAQPPVDRAAGLSPSARRLLEEAGKALSRGRPDDAERALVSIMALAPQSAEAHMLLGVAFQMRGDHTKAAESLNHASTLRPDDAPTLMYLGISLFESGAVEHAIPMFERVCELAPEMASAWYNFGKALKVQLRREESRSAMEHVLKLDPGHILARLSVADTLVGLGNIPAAVTIAKYCAVNPNILTHGSHWQT
jgi:Flp pilus assembly protein TadD